MLNGTLIKRGFHRDQFYNDAEKTFDKLFKYDRNYVESYAAKKTFIKDPYKFFAQLMTLPVTEKSAAFQLLGKAGAPIPNLNIPTNKVQLALKVIKQFKKAINVAKNASSIGI